MNAFEVNGLDFLCQAVGRGHRPINAFDQYLATRSVIFVDLSGTYFRGR
jgi:hypothetical protein